MRIALDVVIIGHNLKRNGTAMMRGSAIPLRGDRGCRADRLVQQREQKPRGSGSAIK